MKIHEDVTMHFVYFWITVLSSTALWLLWTYGFRELILDRFRFQLSGLQDELADICETGCLSVTSDVYQAQYSTLQGLARVAPHFGLLQFATSHLHAEQISKDTSYNASFAFETSIANLQPYVQNRLREVQNKMGLFTLRFLISRAPFVMLLAYSAYFLSYIFGRKKTNDPVETIRLEAYRSGAYSSDDQVMA